MNIRQFDFTDEAAEVLDHLADTTGVDQGEVIRHALSLYKWMIKEYLAESEFVVHRPVTLMRLPLIGDIKGHAVYKLRFNYESLINDRRATTESSPRE